MTESADEAPSRLFLSDARRYRCIPWLNVIEASRSFSRMPFHEHIGLFVASIQKTATRCVTLVPHDVSDCCKARTLPRLKEHSNRVPTIEDTQNVFGFRTR